MTFGLTQLPCEFAKAPQTMLRYFEEGNPDVA